MIKISCPVCVLDGVVILTCRFLGIPDVIMAFLIGILTMSASYWTHSYIKAWQNKYNSKIYRGQLVVIVFIFGIFTVYVFKVFGMW